MTEEGLPMRNFEFISSEDDKVGKEDWIIDRGPSNQYSKSEKKLKNAKRNPEH